MTPIVSGVPVGHVNAEGKPFKVPANRFPAKCSQCETQIWIGPKTQAVLDSREAVVLCPSTALRPKKRTVCRSKLALAEASSAVVYHIKIREGDAWTWIASAWHGAVHAFDAFHTGHRD